MSFVRWAVLNKHAATGNVKKWVKGKATELYQQWRASAAFVESLGSIQQNVMKFWHTDHPDMDIEEIYRKVSRLSLSNS